MFVDVDILCARVCLWVCVREREGDGVLWRISAGRRGLKLTKKCKYPEAPAHQPGPSVSANTPSPPPLLHQQHADTPCITHHPTPPRPGSSSSTTGVTACGPGTCGADTACLPNSKGDRWGEVASTVGWKYWGNWRERKGGRKQPLGLFTLYHLSHKPFATQRAGALPPHRIRAPHPRAWTEVCSGCVGGLLYVKHKSVSARSHGLLCILLLCFCTRISPGPAQTSAAPAGQSGLQLAQVCPLKSNKWTTPASAFGSNACARRCALSCTPVLICWYQRTFAENCGWIRKRRPALREDLLHS